ncbi:MAG: hypothetical protein RIR45_1342, partial [Pseudomonadota bacterium]
MTYSLNTLNSSAPAGSKPPTGVGRFASEVVLIAGFLAIVLWLIALLSYSPQDMAWSTSGSALPISNRVGRLGAWVADLSYFLLGFSVWWCVAACIRWWLAVLADRLRGDGAQSDRGDFMRLSGSPILRSRAAFWLGLALLLYASSSLEWSRLYSLEPRLPGHSGGALGYLLGSLSVQWLGFAGSGLLAIGLGVIGSALVFEFSWLQVAERMGSWVDAKLETRREKREMEQDLEMGQQAAREREEVFLEQHEEIEIHHPKPVVIEPVLVELPPSVRVAKERQKPLFSEMPDSKLPQVALL